MSKTITIDPLTRISGFLELTAEVENNRVINAKTSGLLFRGFEKMLKGRSPQDAIYFTERICGICSTAHSLAATLALEDALKIKPDINSIYLRDIIHGFEFLQNHIRHFYLFTIPSYVKIPQISTIYSTDYKDYRLPSKLNKKLTEDYLLGIEYSRLAHEGLSIIGGKAPHNHGIFIGGVTVNIDSYKIAKVKSILVNIKDFVTNKMLEDMYIISQYYSDYFKKGMSYPNFLSYGVFDNYDHRELTYVKPSLSINGIVYPFDKNKISENIYNSWYTKDTNVDLSKKEGYTFVKTPKYDGFRMEVGPLSRQLLSGEYKGGNSCMDRNIARVLETKKICEILLKLADKVDVNKNTKIKFEILDEATGAGLTDTTRGALAHFIEIKNKLINNYNIITPSGWNLSPTDEDGFHGIAEKSLIGTYIYNTDEPIELGRITRSFDPCVSCATHLTINK